MPLDYHNKTLDAVGPQMTTIDGTSGNDTLNGTSGNDVFDVSQGGNDTVNGLAGDDIVSFGATFNGNDVVNGGTGNDIIRIAGDYSAGITLGTNTLNSVEEIQLGAGFNYKLTTVDANVAAGAQLKIDASNLVAGNTLTFNGAAETNGTFDIIGGAGNDVLTGGAGNDTFDLSHGGEDTVNGGAGDDTFNFGATFDASDVVNGGAGSDLIRLQGDYSGGLTLGADTITGVEEIQVGAGFNYNLTTVDANVAAGAQLKIDAINLAAGNTLTFNGSAETDGKFNIIGGAGNDVLTGGAGNDIFDLSQGGEDTVNGGAGDDIIKMGAALDPNDVINGGTGTNKIELDGNYAGADALVLGATTIQNIEQMKLLGAGYNYDITENDANLALGQTLSIDASAIGVGNTFTFNGSAETDGKFEIKTGAGTYHLTGGARSDKFELGATFTDSDSINGGSPGGHTGLKLPDGDDFGINHVSLEGNYTGATALNLGVNALEDIQVIALQEPTDGSGPYSYNITSVAGTFGPNTCGLPVTFVCTDFTNADNFTWNDSGIAGPLIDRVFAWNAGTYNLSFGAANDLFYVGGAWNAANTLNGGGGSDTLALNGEFLETSLNASYTGTNALVFGANQLTSVENLGLTGGYSYNITMNDGNVAAGQTMTIEADSFSGEAGGTNDEVLSALLPGDTLTFDGSAETDGHFVLDAGAGTYIVKGGQQSDTFNFGATFSAADQLDGQGGNDTLNLDGDYSGGLTFGASTLTSIETLNLTGGHSYNLTTNDANVASGATLTVNASALGAGNTLVFDGSAETNGGFDITGGAGNDVIKLGGPAVLSASEIDGGAGNDTLNLNGAYGTSGTPFALTAAMLTSVETISFQESAAHASYFQAASNLLATGQTLTVDASGQNAGSSLSFDGSAETNGNFVFIGGPGTLIATGGAGNDLFEMNDDLEAADQLSGGGGSDTLVIDGLPGDAITFGPDTISNIGQITLGAGHNYDITENDANLAIGQTLTINATAVGAGDTFTFDGSAETDGKFIIEAGAGTYHLTGGARTDVFELGANFTDSDSINGGSPNGHVGLKLPSGNDYGTNRVTLSGNYTGAHALNLGVNALEDIQVIQLGGGHSYNITSVAGSFGPNSCGFPVTFVCTNFTASNNFTWTDSGAAGPLIDRVFAWNAGSYNLTFGAANDLFYVGGAWNAANTLNGGGGSDTLALNAEFLNTALNASYTGTNALTFGANQLTSVENLGLTGGYSYNITMNDGNVQAGQTMTIEANGYSAEAGGGDKEVLPALMAGDTLTFNGAAETDGNFVFDAGAGTYHLIGGAQADIFNFGATFSATDTINGGGGADVLNLDGNYSGGLTFAAGTITNIDTISLAAGHSYSLTTNDANVAAGATMTVDGSALGASDSLTFNGSAESDGNFVINGGAGNDNLQGGKGADTFNGGNGADTFNGGGGANIFVYSSGAQSNSNAVDHITDFHAGADKFDFSFTVSAIATVFGSVNNLGASLAAAIGDNLADHGAVEVHVNGGTFAGDTFLVVDANGNAAYDAGTDYVINLTVTAADGGNLALSMKNFI